MANKLLKTRMQQKIDTSQNWAKATNFVPLKGEICIYSDLHKMKIGDGTTKIGDLDFFETVASSTTLGSIKADAKTETDTVPARIDTDGKLWVKVPDAPLIVTVTNAGNNTGTADYSSSEILAAVSAGREVYLRGSMNGITLVFAFGGTFQGQPFFYNIFTMGLAPGAMLAMVEGNQVTVNNAGFTTIDDLDTFKNMIKSQLLPEVTASDNDKILKVVNGAWSTANLDKGVLVVNFDLIASGSNQQYAEADKTPTDIASALNNGQIVAGVFNYNNVTYILILNNAVNGLVFSTTIASDNKIQTISLVYENSNTRYKIIDEKIESFTDTEIETFYNANA